MDLLPITVRRRLVTCEKVATCGYFHDPHVVGLHGQLWSIFKLGFVDVSEVTNWAGAVSNVCSCSTWAMKRLVGHGQCEP